MRARRAGGVIPLRRSSSSPSETPSSTPVVAAALVVSLDEISVTNSDGTTGDSAQFSEGASVLALLSRATGSTPTPVHDEHYGFTSYDWGGLGMTVRDSDGTAWVKITAPASHGIALQTSEGVHVGSTLAEVKAVASPDTEFSPPGTSDTYIGLQARPHPGTDSLTFPGQVGLDYIDVDLKDGIVTQLIAPSGNWQDV